MMYTYGISTTMYKFYDDGKYVEHTTVGYVFMHMLSRIIDVLCFGYILSPVRIVHRKYGLVAMTSA